MIKLSLGNVGCLEGQTIININRCCRGNTVSLKHIYNMFHNNYKNKNKVWDLSKPTFVRSFNGERIVLHKIKDVFYSGRKFVYKMCLKDGTELKATSQHRIMTQDGFIPLYMCQGKKVMKDTLKPQKGQKRSYKLPDININGEFHPYKNKIGKIEIHRVIYEAYLNNLKLSDFLDIIWNDKNAKNKYKFLNPKIYHIHHKDFNHFNNDIHNLMVLKSNKHIKFHASLEGFKNFNQGLPYYVECNKIEKLDYYDTYDIECEEPFNNFVANGIVVHNSGKTVCEVRDIVLNPMRRKTYSNIEMEGVPNNITIDSSMIITKKVKKEIKKKSGEIERVYDMTLNQDFWKNIKEPINFVLDEAHQLLNPRRSMTKVNILMTDFLSLIRRILGSNDAGEGTATFITQIPRRLDVITKEMATEVKYHICHYEKVCPCKMRWSEHSDLPKKVWVCPKCGNPEIKKQNFVIEVWHFPDIESYENFKFFGSKSYFEHYFINDIEKYFKYYNTLQWSNMFSELY